MTANMFDVIEQFICAKSRFASACFYWEAQRETSVSDDVGLFRWRTQSNNSKYHSRWKWKSKSSRDWFFSLCRHRHRRNDDEFASIRMMMKMKWRNFTLGTKKTNSFFRVFSISIHIGSWWWCRMFIIHRTSRERVLQANEIGSRKRNIYELRVKYCDKEIWKFFLFLRLLLRAERRPSSAVDREKFFASESCSR